jgi:hypothetical protein
MQVDDYRFQVQLNTQRFQWYTALDVALITVGTGLLRLSGPGDGRFLTSLVFITGLALALFAGIATQRQLGYQHAARAQAKKIADRLGISEMAISSTPGWRGSANPWWNKARTVNQGLLAVLGAVNAAAFGYLLVTH